MFILGALLILALLGGLMFLGYAARTGIIFPILLTAAFAMLFKSFF